MNENTPVLVGVRQFLNRIDDIVIFHPLDRDEIHHIVRLQIDELATRLADNEWLTDDYSIAAIANWSWVRIHGWSGVSTEGLPGLLLEPHPVWVLTIQPYHPRNTECEDCARRCCGL